MVFFKRIHNNSDTTNSIASMTDAEIWLNQLNKTIDQQIQTQSIDNQRLARMLGVSERQLFRKVKQYTKQSPRQYIRNYRLARAMECMRMGNCQTVNEAADLIGYRNVSYFIAQFEQKYGKRPLEVLKEAGWR